LLKPFTIPNAHPSPIVALQDHEWPGKSESGRLRFAVKDVLEESVQGTCRSLSAVLPEV
jgi:hypothetical protein